MIDGWRTLHKKGDSYFRVKAIACKHIKLFTYHICFIFF